MLGLVTPPDVRRSFNLPPEVVAAGEKVVRSRLAVQTKLIGSGQMQLGADRKDELAACVTGLDLRECDGRLVQGVRALDGRL